jgi:hypothetical protein
MLNVDPPLGVIGASVLSSVFKVVQHFSQDLFLAWRFHSDSWFSLFKRWLVYMLRLRGTVPAKIIQELEDCAFLCCV